MYETIQAQLRREFLTALASADLDLDAEDLEILVQDLIARTWRVLFGDEEEPEEEAE